MAKSTSGDLLTSQGACSRSEFQAQLAKLEVLLRELHMLLECFYLILLTY